MTILYLKKGRSPASILSLPVTFGLLVGEGPWVAGLSASIMLEILICNFDLLIRSRNWLVSLHALLWQTRHSVMVFCPRCVRFYAINRTYTRYFYQCSCDPIPCELLKRFHSWPVILQLAIHTSALCYYPNGTASDDVPCNQGAGDTFCCGIDYACLSNKLCSGTVGSAGAHFGRGGFTDKTCTIELLMLDLFCSLVLTSPRGQ